MISQDSACFSHPKSRSGALKIRHFSLDIALSGDEVTMARSY